MVYYYSDGQQQIGPISKDELKLKGITKETLVWCEGLSNWTKAGEVEDLADLFPKIPTPPPMPKQEMVTPPPIPEPQKVAPPPMPEPRITTQQNSNQSIANTPKEMVFNGKLFVLINIIAVCFGALLLLTRNDAGVLIIFFSFLIGLILGFVKKIEKPQNVVFNRNIFILIIIIGVTLSFPLADMYINYSAYMSGLAIMILFVVLCGWISGKIWKISPDKIWFKKKQKVETAKVPSSNSNKKKIFILLGTFLAIIIGFVVYENINKRQSPHEYLSLDYYDGRPTLIGRNLEIEGSITNHSNFDCYNVRIRETCYDKDNSIIFEDTETIFDKTFRSGCSTKFTVKIKRPKFKTLMAVDRVELELIGASSY